MKIYTVNAIDEFDRMFGASQAIPESIVEDELLVQLIGRQLVEEILRAMGTAASAEWSAGAVEFENVFDLMGGAS